MGCVGRVSINSSPRKLSISYLLWVPSNRANSFAAHVIQRQALLLSLDIPDGDESSTAASRHDVSNLFIPIQAFNIIGTGCIVAKSEWTFKIVDIGNEEFAFSTTASQEVGVLRVELEGLDGTRVIGGS